MTADPMDEESPVETAILESDPWARSAKRLLGMFDTPAYLRRALAVEDSLRHVRLRCEKQRSQYLEGVRGRLRVWNRLVVDGRADASQLIGSQFVWTQSLCEAVFTKEDRRLAATSAGGSSTAWRDLVGSIERFNHRWRRFIAVVDVEVVNRKIDAYNRNYVFEKECATGSPSVAARGFRTLEPLCQRRLLEMFPLLPTLDDSTCP